MDPEGIPDLPETLSPVIPSREYRKAALRHLEKVPSGVAGAVHKASGLMMRHPFAADSLRAEAFSIHADAESLRTLSDGELRGRLLAASELFRRRGHRYTEGLRDAMPLLVEASARVLGMRPYPVQVMGALALLDGSLVEMQTGEGKTLVAGLAGVVFGWSGRPCHVITVNDYLAVRDHSIITPLFSFCGLSSGVVTAELDRNARRANYANAVVYVTSKELVADFLRDRLALKGVADPARRYLHPSEGRDAQPVLSGLSAAVVDEADCILVDDAATPLLISRPVKNTPLMSACRTAVAMIGSLHRDEHYLIDPRFQQVILTSDGIDAVERMAAGMPSFWHSEGRRNELLVKALAAREFFRNGKEYVVREGKVVIIDEFTGRLMPDRKWRQGTQQIIEALEGVEMTDPSDVSARISFQRFFRYFETLSGMTGTVRGVASEIWNIYGLKCVTIPTNRPSLRKILPPKAFSSETEKYSSIIEDIERCHQTGQPVLVGTRTVRASEAIAALLELRGLPFRLLNALSHKEEASIVARAGERHAITIATNMAGRGTDIRLGEGVAGLGGLHVIVAEPNEAGRIDYQFYGRCARQGDPGSAGSFISFDELLIRRFFSARFIEQLSFIAGKSRIPGIDFLPARLAWLAQMRAESMAYRQRISLMRKDDHLDEMMSFFGSGPKF